MGIISLPFILSNVDADGGRNGVGFGVPYLSGSQTSEERNDPRAALGGSCAKDGYSVFGGMHVSENSDVAVALDASRSISYKPCLGYCSVHSMYIPN